MSNPLREGVLGTKIIALLAFVQGGFGVLRALHWFDMGSDLFGQGLLILPLVGVVAFLRGAFITAIALLYVVFAWGMMLRRAWASWVGIVAAAVNLLLVFSVLAQGEPIGRTLLWAVIPLIILLYLLSASAGQTLARGK
jgi:uncharacterized membrane protein (DUF2068 family)